MIKHFVAQTGTGEKPTLVLVGQEAVNVIILLMFEELYVTLRQIYIEDRIFATKYLFDLFSECL